MGKLLKTCLFIGMVCILAGVALSGAGIFSGGLPQLKEQIQNGDWSIKIGEMEPIFELEVPEYFDKDEIINVDAENMEETFASESINKLILKASGVTVEWNIHGGQDFVVEQTGVQQYQTYVRDNVLNIAAQNNQIRHQQGKVVISIPESSIQDEHLAIMVESSACAIDLGEMVASEVDIHMSAGTVSWDKLTAEILGITMEAGLLTGQNTTISEEAVLKVSAGSLEVDGTLGIHTDIEMNAGKLKANLREQFESYNYKVSCAGGSVKLDEHTSKGFAESYEVNNNASKNINIECSIGAVNIQFDN